MRETGHRTLAALGLIVFACALLAVPAANAAVVTVVNGDAGTAKGFDDRTPVAPVGGNPGTTLGAQRLNALQRAATTWGSSLSSAVDIVVRARFLAFGCRGDSVFLGAAGPTVVEANFPRAPHANTWYPVALANKLAGVDLDPPAPAGLDGDDIVAYFNATLDGGSCLKGARWYYGFDGEPEGNDIDFLTVSLHELGHGLGASSMVNAVNGQNLGPNRLNDAWNHFLLDASTGKRWKDLSAEERALSAVNSGNLTWAGPLVTTHGKTLTSGLHPNGYVRMYAPNPVQVGASISHFDLGIAPPTLKQPFISSPTHDLGMALALLEDLGWTTNLCGNGSAERSESCDVGDFRGNTCRTQGDYTHGFLRCNASCDGFLTDQCFKMAPDTPLGDIALVTIPATTYMVRTLEGGYAQHTGAIVELDRLTAHNPKVRSARQGPVTGFYYTDPSLVSQARLSWDIGIPVDPNAKAIGDYTIKVVPEMQALVVNSTVEKAPYDGMRLIMWLEANGYDWVAPVRMEFSPSSQSATGVEEPIEEEHPSSSELALQGHPGALVTTRIITPVRKIEQPQEASRE